MKETTIKCDVCKKEINKTRGESVLKPTPIGLQVIFTTEQDEGRSCNPYISDEKLDLCGECREYVIEGNYIFASGAQGHNSYSFKTKKK